MKATSLQSLGSEKVINLNSANGVFDFEDKKIIPVEMATFRTVNFSEPQNESAILYSTSLSACAAVVIKNYNPETKKYDNVVTMGHFYPGNALTTEHALKNLRNVFNDFTNNGGVLSDRTSVQLFGGAKLPDEDIMGMTPIGPMIDAIQILQSETGFKFKHHDKTMVDARGYSYSTFPTVSSLTIGISKEGTALTKFTTDKLSRLATVSTVPSYPEVASMPLGLMSQLNHNSFYPAEIDSFLVSRAGKISELVDREIPMSKMEDAMKLAQRIMPKSANNERSIA